MIEKVDMAHLQSTYEQEDPWGYQRCPGDLARKDKILDTIRRYGPHNNVLDIACGEGWITTDIAADNIYGLEVADKARDRWPSNIRQWDRIGCELILITGALYYSYDWEYFLHIINEYGTKYVITSNIADREIVEVDRIEGELIHLEEYPYVRDTESFTQRLRVYKILNEG